MITLKTLPQASAQDVFDQVAKHLLTQMEKAGETDEEGNFNCYYRDSEGKACAAGCLIAEDEYDRAMENNGWLTLGNMGRVPETHMALTMLITKLQQVHDDLDVPQWRPALENLAYEFKLDPSVAKSP